MAALQISYPVFSETVRAKYRNERIQLKIEIKVQQKIQISKISSHDKDAIVETLEILNLISCMWYEN